MDNENSSGYSSAPTSPETSEEDLLGYARWGKIRLELKSRSQNNLSEEGEKQKNEEKKEEVELVEKKEDSPEEFCPVVTPNEIEPHKTWYHNLLMFRSEFRKEKRAPFPPFPPPPLPSVMIAASEAFIFNPFEDTKKAATQNLNSPATVSLEKQENRFRPADFRPLPPPHVYLEMIRTLAPHQYIDLTYALAGSVLLDLGFRIPEYYPPLPPKIEPFRDLNAEETLHMTETSAESSSDGEYSDTSEHSRFIDRLKRRKDKEKRNTAREMRYAARRISEKETLKTVEETPKRETFPRDCIYKDKTLSTFIPRPIHRRPPIPSFFPLPIPHGMTVPSHPAASPPTILPFPPYHPMNGPPLWLRLPSIPLLSPPVTPKEEKVNAQKNPLRLRPNNQ